MKNIIRSRLTKGLLVVLLATGAPSLVFGQDQPDFSRTLRQSGAHQISGYVTLGLATTVAALGLFGSDLHPAFGWGVAGTSVVTLALGSLAYRDRLVEIWPHSLLATLATTGFLMNAFGVFPFGSQEHVITGITSVGLLYGAYVTILLITM